MLKSGTRFILMHIARVNNMHYNETEKCGELSCRYLSIVWEHQPKQRKTYSLTITPLSRVIRELEYSAEDIDKEAVFAAILNAVATMRRYAPALHLNELKRKINHYQ